MTKMTPYAEFKVINLNDLKIMTTECYTFYYVIVEYVLRIRISLAKIII